jgi:hypothetical protein
MISGRRNSTMIPPDESERRIAKEKLEWDREHNRPLYYTKVILAIIVLLVVVIGIIAVLHGATGNPYPATNTGP